MAMLLFAAVFLSASALVCELFERRLEEAMPLTASLMILAAYVFALAGYVRQGALAVLGLCALGLPAALVLAARRGRLRALFERIFTPAVLIYALLCMAAVLANAGKPVHTWDEFTYWADAVKVMTLHGVLPADAAARSLFGAYPPALPLWEYFAQALNALLGRGFDEGLLFMSYQCLMFAFFMPFLRGVRLRRPLEWLACAAGVPLCVLAVFPAGLDLLHSDMLLGVLGGFAVAWPLLQAPDGRFSRLTLCAALAVTVLVKDAGLLYALAGVAAAYLCLRTPADTPCLGRKSAALRALGPLGCVLAARLSWSAAVAVFGATAQATFSNPISIGTLLSPEGAWRRTTLRNFLYKIFEKGVSVGGTDVSVSWLMAFVLLGAGFAALYGAVRGNAHAQRLKRAGYLTFATATLYILGTGATYVFKFYEDEAVRMASYSRYMSIAVLAVGFVLFVCAVCMRSTQNFIGGYGKRGSALALAALLLFSPGERLLDAVTRLDAQAAVQKQQEYLDMEARVRALAPTGEERVYILAPGSGGFEHYVLRYRLRPLFVGDEPWNPVQDASKADRFTAALSPQQLRTRLAEGYDLLALCTVTEDFIKDYGMLFENPEAIAAGQIYRVDRERGLLLAAE